MHKALSNLSHMDEMIRRLFHIAELNLYKKILSVIRRLQRTNETVQKCLADTHAQTKLRMLICQIRQSASIEYDRFNEVYTDFVKRKRRCLLEEINQIDSQRMKSLRKRDKIGLPNEGLPAKTQMRLATLETYYAYLKDDDAYHQKAFKLFLKKKIEEMAENGADCSKMEAYLENKRKNLSYEEYIACISRPMDIRLPKLWVAFFRSGTGYKNVLPKERPHVAYASTATDVPRFIFEEPYTHEYSEQEFCTKFMSEWDTTHNNPYYDDDYDDPAYYEDYRSELAGRPQSAYLQYLCAVNRFKQIRQRLKGNAKGCERRNKNGIDIQERRNY